MFIILCVAKNLFIGFKYYMRILPISYLNTSNNHTRNIKPHFMAHPDFYKYNSVQSCFFRRGSVLLSCAKGYEDIENLFFKIFNSDNGLKNMLIVGIGSSQEPFSFLTSIKGILKESKLKNNLDLYAVDLQSKPEQIDLKLNAFCDLYDYQSFPQFAKNGFVKDNTDDWFGIKQEKKYIDPIIEYSHYFLCYRKRWKELEQKGYSLEEILNIFRNEDKQRGMRWRVNDEVFEFLEKTYDNPQKSNWDSRIQDIIQTYPDNKFDIISANNVIPYITALSRSEAALTIKHMIRTLKPNGYIITDPYKNEYHVREITNSNKMKEIFSGIYQKISG